MAELTDEIRDAGGETGWGGGGDTQKEETEGAVGVCNFAFV